MPNPKQCLICGEWFTPQSNSQRLCGKIHTRKCVICGKEFVIKSSATTTQTCSRKCTARLREQTMLDRYGVAFSMQSEMFQKKSEETQLRKYGVKRAAQNESIKQKTREHFVEKFGVDNPMKSKEVQEKAKQTCRERYGSDYANASPEKIQRAKETNMKKYGCEYPLGNPVIHKAFTDKMYEKYGVPYYYMSQDCINRRKIPIPLSNLEFQKQLQDIGVNTELEFPIENYLYDLHILDSNILVEINPSWSHNIAFNPWGNTGVPINYHVGKSQVAKEHGYMCIHVWDWDDISRVVSEFFGTKHKLYARKCSCNVISNLELEQFESRNYLLEYSTTPTIAYGLFYNQILVATMCFLKIDSTKYEWKLLRFCCDASYRVVGAASKLFHRFLEENSPDSVVSYCDNSKYTGEVCKYLDMNIVGYTDPECIWSLEGSPYSIPNNLLQGATSIYSLNLPEGDSIENYTESYLWNQSKSRKWLPVYTCGCTIFEYRR